MQQRDGGRARGTSGDRTARNDVRRDALIERVRLAPAARFVLVQAPAGYGKSTLLRQLAAEMAQQNIPCAWVTVGPNDADITRFFSLLDQACSRLVSAGIEGAAPGAGDLAAKLSALSGPAALFIDDLDYVLTDEVAAMLAQVVRDLPPGKQLYAASRTMPPLPITRWQLSGEALVIGSVDLRFDLSEAFYFLSEKAHLGLEEVRELHARTDGWPAALQFLNLALARSHHLPAASMRTGMTPELIDYLATSVLTSQPESLRRCLLETCFAEKVCADLVRELCGNADGQDLLEAISRAGLFLDPVDADRVWFRYHKVFRDYLLAQARRNLSQEELCGRHVRIAEWYARHDMAEEAIDHFLQAGDQDRAAELLEQAVGRLVREERLGLIVTLVEQFADDRIYRSPAILNAAIIAYGFRRLFREAHRLLDRREKDLEGSDPTPRQRGEIEGLRVFVLAAEDRVAEFGQVARDTLHLLSEEDAFTYAVALNAYSFWLTTQSQFQEAHDLLLQAKPLHQATQNFFGHSYQESILGSLLVSQGRVREAVRNLTKALREAESKTPIGSLAGAVIGAYLGDGLYEMNDLDQAESLLSSYLPLIEQQCIVDPLTISLVALARIAVLRGRRELAHEMIDNLVTFGHRFGLSRLVIYGRAELARMATLGGDLAAAKTRLQSLGTQAAATAESQSYFHAGEIEAQRITYARYLVHAGRQAEARAILQAELRTASLKRRWRRYIRLQTLFAISLDMEDQQAAARRAMMDALKAAEPGGFVRIFLDEGPRVSKILRDIAQENIAKSSRWTDDPLAAYVAKLIRAETGGTEPMVVGDADLVMEPATITLTERERDLLKFVVNGYSNQDLAARLSVSANTVKWHLRNIYDKLGVRNRMQAVHVARHLGLMD